MLQRDWPPSTNPYNLHGPVPAGTTAVIVPMRDGMPFFKLAFYSLLAFTATPWVLVVVDNMSGFETKQTLRNMGRKNAMTVVRYDQEFNFAAECNAGLRRAFQNPNVAYGLILNSDTVVSPFWLNNLAATFSTAGCERVGLVGPVTNIAIPEQQKPTTSEIEATNRLSGFCMLFRREVFETLGGFDEEFKGGGFEDEDFCVRAREAGWQLAVNRYVHVTHFWKLSRRDPQHDAAMRKNQALFFAKHPNGRAHEQRAAAA